MNREAPRISNGAGTGGSGRAAVRPSPESGYAMAALLVGMSVMAVFMSAALPVWSTAAKRLKEDELVFRGEQYARAIALYQRKYANQLPPSIDVLLNERFLRRKYLDPITGEEFQALTGAVGQTAPGMGAGGRGATAPGMGASGRGATGAGRQGGLGAQPGPGPGSSGMGQQTTGRGASFGGGSTAGPGGSFQTGFQTGAFQTSTGARGAAGIGAGTSGPTGSPFGGSGGIVGVASKSKEKSLRLYNGRDVYNEWAFVAVQRQLQAGGGEGSAAPGLPGRGQTTPGQPNQGQRGTGPRGFGSGSDAFRPNPTGPGSGGGFRPAGSSGGFGR
jgi:type II secretory pathway pseudopilin PulG